MTTFAAANARNDPEMPAKVAKLQRDIQSKIELQSAFAPPHVKARKLMSMFRQYDLNDNGCMDINEFFGVLERLNFCQDAAVADALFQKFDANGNGSLDFSEFANGIFGLQVISMETAAVRDVVAIVKDKLLERSGAGSLPALIRVFRVMDESGNNKLDRHEMMSGLQAFGVQVTRDELDTLFQYFDKDGSGQIHIDEFLQHLIPPMPETRRNLCKAAFDLLDVNGDGTVSIEELLVKYEVAEHPDVLTGKMTAEEVVAEFSAAWDESGDGIITFDEFCEYYRNMSSLIVNDEYFEGMIKKAWALDTPTAARCKPGIKAMVTHIDGRQAVYTVEGLHTIQPTEVAKLKAALMRQGVQDIKSVRVV